MESAERILVGAVTDPASPPATPPPELLDEIENHPLAPLAWDALIRAGCVNAWPEALRRTLRHASAAQMMLSDLYDAELRRVLDALGNAGVRVLVIKGAALAHTHYRRPHLRPRNDSDIVIADTQSEAVAPLLADLGYVKSHAVDGTLVTQQAQWRRVLGAGVEHALDVHWRVFNPHLFADVLSFDSLMKRAVPVPPLGASAFVPCAVDALVLACAHRIAHHPGYDDAVWDFDVHLLASTLRDEDIADVQQLVAAAGLRAVVAACVGSAASRFGTAVPPAFQAFLSRASDYQEPTAVFLDRGRRQVDVLLSDLSALRGWRARMTLLWQHLVPPPRYMLEKYGRRSRAWLPWLYVRRLFGGLPRWLGSQRS